MEAVILRVYLKMNKGGKGIRQDVEEKHKRGLQHEEVCSVVRDGWMPEGVAELPLGLSVMLTVTQLQLKKGLNSIVAHLASPLYKFYLLSC